MFNLQDGQLEGPGRAMFVNGDVYDGFFSRGKFHGPGDPFDQLKELEFYHL